VVGSYDSVDLGIFEDLITKTEWLSEQERQLVVAQVKLASQMTCDLGF
jgi:hypothetical protein